MEIPESTLRSTASLLLDPEESVVNQTRNVCINFNQSKRDPLISAIINVLDENMEEIPDKCVVFVDTIEKMHEVYPLSENQIKNVFKVLYKLFTDRPELTNPLSKPSIQLLIAFVKTEPELIFDTFKNTLNEPANPHILRLFHHCVKLHDSLLNKKLKDYLSQICTLLKNRDQPCQLINYLDIIVACYESIEDIESCNMHNYYNLFAEFFSAVFSQWVDENLDDESLNTAFDVVTKLIRCFTPEQATELIQVKLNRYHLFVSKKNTGHNAVYCLDQLLSLVKEPGKIISSSSERLPPALFDYLEENMESFAIPANQKYIDAALKIFVYFEQSKGIILDSAIKKMTTVPSVGCAVVKALVDECLHGVKGTLIASTMSEVLQKKLDLQGRKYSFALFCSLCHLRINITSILQLAFQMASSPDSTPVRDDFLQSISKIAPTMKIDNFLDIAMEPKFVNAAFLCFTAMSLCENDPSYTLESEVYLPRAMFYASCPFFSSQTRFHIIRVIARVTSTPEAKQAVDTYDEKECHSCTQKRVHQFIQAMMRNSLDQNLATGWIDSIIDFSSKISSDIHHPDAPKIPVLSPADANAAAYTSVATLLSGDLQQTQLTIKFTQLLNRFQMTSDIECQSMAIALETISNYNGTYALESFKNKAETKRFMSKGSSNTLFLEFASRCLGLDTKFEGRVVELLNDESIPISFIAHAQHRLLKKGAYDGQKMLEIILKIFDSGDERVIKTALSSFQYLVENQKVTMDESLSIPLQKVIKVITKYDSVSMLKIADEIFHKTPIEANFNNLCSLIFTESEEVTNKSINLLVDLVETCKDTSHVKTPVVAASLTIMLLHQPLLEKSRILAEKIFSYTRAADDFALSYYLSSAEDIVAKYIPCLFKFINMEEPWSTYCEVVIKRLSIDPRFSAVFDNAFESFGRQVALPTHHDLSPLCQLLFNLDKTKFITLLLSKPEEASPNLISILAQNFGLMGIAIIEIGNRTKFSPDNKIHASILHIIEQSNIPMNQQLSVYVFILLIIAQSRDYADLGESAMQSLVQKYPEIGTLRIHNTFQEYKAGNCDFVCFRTWFGVVAKDLIMHNIAPFANIFPTAALAGYSEIIYQGRPMTYEILDLAKKAPNAALLCIPTIKLLTPDRYGEKAILDILDFILDQTDNDDESFNCIIELFNWIPKETLMQRASQLFNSTQSALRRVKPPVAAFSCVSNYSKTLLFAGNADFKEVLPMFIVLSYCFSEHKNPEIVTVARNALCSLASFAGMTNTIVSLRRTIGDPESFLLENSPVLVKEMDIRCIDAAYHVLEDPSIIAKINATLLLCACMNQKIGSNKGIHLRLVTLLTSEDAELKCGVLKAIKQFPPIL